MVNLENVFTQGGIAGVALLVLYLVLRGVLGLLVGAITRNTEMVTRVEAKLDAWAVGRAPTEPGHPPVSPPPPEPPDQREA